MTRQGRRDPDRLYTLTGGRSRSGPDTPFDLVTLVVAECEPVPGMQSEHAAILRMCERPTAVVEIAAELGLPVTHRPRSCCPTCSPRAASAPAIPHATVAVRLPDPDILEQVLVGLRNL